MAGGDIPKLIPFEHELTEIPPGALLMSLDEWIGPDAIIDTVGFVTDTAGEIAEGLIDIGVEGLLILIENAKNIHNLANAAQVAAQFIHFLNSHNISIVSIIENLEGEAKEFFQGFLEQ